MTLPVPIIDHDPCEGREGVTGLTLSFVAVAQRWDLSTEPSIVSVIALQSYMPVGALKWDLCDGQILDVWVRPAWRRRKVATVMLGVAEALAAENDWEWPCHSHVRSQEGEAWALAMGAGPAETIEAHEESPDAEARAAREMRAWGNTRAPSQQPPADDYTTAYVVLEGERAMVEDHPHG